MHEPSATSTTINVNQQTTQMEFAQTPAWAYGSDILVTLSDANGIPIRERTVFFYLYYPDGTEKGYPVITDYAGRADLSGLPLTESENVQISAHFNKFPILGTRVDATDEPDYTPEIPDVYLPCSVGPITVNLLNSLLEDALLFAPTQVDVHYKSSGNGKNATDYFYTTASIAGEVAFNTSLQPSDIIPGGDVYVDATVVAYLAGKLIASETVQLDTRGDNGNHWTTTSIPSNAVNYVGIHWVDAPRFDTAFSNEPGPRIYTSYIGNNFSDIHYEPVAGTYSTTLPDGSVIVVKNGKVNPVDKDCTALKNYDWVIDEDDNTLTLFVKFGIEPGDEFTTTGFDKVTVIDGFNYVVEGGNMIIRLDAVASTPLIKSSDTPNLFEFRFFLGTLPDVVDTSARIGDGANAVPWSSEDPGHKQYRP